MAQLKPGTRMRSSVCATEVMVVAAPKTEVELTCGGAPMVGHDAAPARLSVPSDPRRAQRRELDERAVVQEQLGAFAGRVDPLALGLDPGEPRLAALREHLALVVRGRHHGGDLLVGVERHRLSPKHEAFLKSSRNLRLSSSL